MQENISKDSKLETDKTSAWLYDLSPVLFWDVNIASIDIKKHKRWLLERILEYGQWNDWLLIKNHIAKKEMEDLYSQLHVDPKSLNFLKKYLWA